MYSTTDFYDHNVEELNAVYLAVSSTDVHKSWIELLPSEGSVLDIGAGTGRDSAFMADCGLDVVAVEPSYPMLLKAQQNFPDKNILWLNEGLPALEQTIKLQRKFSLILVSAVWMHIIPSDRERCIRKLCSLLAPNGKIVITLRHGEFTDERIAQKISSTELSKLATQFGLIFEGPEEVDADALGRAKISWETVILTQADNRAGAFPAIRHIVLDEQKYATQKLALLRAVLRIAEGHPGAEIKPKSTPSHIALPLGLVAMYWLKMFKPMVDMFAIPQNAETKKVLSFVKQSGWQQLDQLSNNDFFIGAVHTQHAAAVHSTLLHITRSIKNIALKHIKEPDTQQAVFATERLSPRVNKRHLVLAPSYLAGFGTFYVPIDIRDSFAKDSCWIEPTLVNEWTSLMQRFAAKANKHFSLEEYRFAHTWEDASRATEKVRQRINTLRKSQDVYCAWSATKLRGKYAVDHAFPFARWPNNDLWNLLPCKSNIHRQKLNKLPSLSKCLDAKEIVLDFWQAAWADEKELFFMQANMALPSLPLNNNNFGDVFDAMLAQRQHIKDVQQLLEWGGKEL